MAIRGGGAAMAEFKIGPLWAGDNGEAAIIGRIVLGYTEIEIAVWEMLKAVLGDGDAAARIIWRAGQADARLAVADALIRPAAVSANLLKKYTQTLGEIHSCREARNQFAHGYWDRSATGVLECARLETAAKERDGNLTAALLPYSLHKLKHIERQFIRTHRAAMDLAAALSASRPPSVPPPASAEG